MHKTLIVLSALLFVLCLGVSSIAEEITLTTYYPAPYGAYKEFTTTENTCLATISGNVGIGTTAPGYLLSLKGAANGESVAFGDYTYFGSAYSSANAIVGHMVRPRRGSGTYEKSTALNIAQSMIEAGPNISFATKAADASAAGTAWDLTVNTKMIILNNGSVGIGITNPSYKLDVAGDINTTGDIRKTGVAYNNPDYVFEAGYNIMPLSELKGYIETNKHLPNMPSTQEVKVEGIKIFEQNRLILEKLEEAYLYIIDLEQRIKKLEGR